ncbi:hypothetical protein MIND_01276000 [Mycena indigotica]|uniref:Glycosyltransferase family 4 protein n=1 Tax=Mycena indigotica TaxID=2126181 RepID=A0A8H6VRG5_9AGAR|nr:uncharacterized protein MIND_01276000 [Mycena indigotica]KAF7291317.1 hypothetical protein MIND_01276000 [Mycena indigotica]
MASLLPLHNSSGSFNFSKDLTERGDRLRVAIIAENFLPKVDGSTTTIASLLQQLKRNHLGVQAMLFGPESGMKTYHDTPLFGTPGLPLHVYPGLKINFITPSLIRTLREFDPHVIHLVDPIWLGVQALAAIALLFPTVPVVTSHHTNLPTYADVFGYPYFKYRTWGIQAYLHSFARCTLVPSASTAGLLAERRFKNIRVISRGVDLTIFDPSLRSESMRQAWFAAASSFPPSHIPPVSVRSNSSIFSSSTFSSADQVVVLSVGRLSPEKNLTLIINSIATLPPSIASRVTLVFVGDGPSRVSLHSQCAAKSIRAVFTGHLSGHALGTAFASGDIMCAPSITETFGQTTLQGMAAGLPVVGLLAEGTADLVQHGRTGLLLDVLEAAGACAPWSPLMPPKPGARVVGWEEAAPLLGDDVSSERANVIARFACLLEVLVEDSERRRQMGREAAKSARQTWYEWEACAGRVVAAYREAVGVSASIVSDGKAKALTPSPDVRNVSSPAALGSTTLVLRRPATIHWSLPPTIQFLVDGAVVLHALGLALTSHLMYMVPSRRDLSERIRWRTTTTRH